MAFSYSIEMVVCTIAIRKYSFFGRLSTVLRVVHSVTWVTESLHRLVSQGESADGFTDMFRTPPQTVRLSQLPDE
jgi:hypothetical protein